MASPIIEGGYVRDILAQPGAVQATLDGLALTPAMEDLAQRSQAGRFERLVLTGMGGSYSALLPFYFRLLASGQPAVLMETSELIHSVPGLLGTRTLVVALSQSGRSAEIVRMLERKPSGCAILAITNTSDSPLARQADAVVLTQAGEEFTVSCKTYLASLVALAWIAAIWTGQPAGEITGELAQGPGLVRAYLERWREHVAEAEEVFAGVRRLFLLGRGSSLAAAGTGALITKESAHFHAEGMSSAAFRHGPFEMLDDGLMAVVFAGEGTALALNRNLVRDILSAGGRAVLVGEEADRAVFRLPPAPATVRPLLEILPVEMMTLALAAMTGREAGKFERATKVTATE